MYVISVFIRSCAYFTKYKSLSLVTKIKLPQVVGSLLAGLLGPAVLNIIHEMILLSSWQKWSYSILFNAGLESNLSDLKSGKTSFIVAVMGVITFNWRYNFSILYKPW